MINYKFELPISISQVAFESNSINQGSDKYKQLLMENLELEKAYSKLQSEVGGQNDSGRMQLVRMDYLKACQ